MSAYIMAPKGALPQALHLDIAVILQLYRA